MLKEKKKIRFKCLRFNMQSGVVMPSRIAKSICVTTFFTHPQEIMMTMRRQSQQKIFFSAFSSIQHKSNNRLKLPSQSFMHFNFNTISLFLSIHLKLKRAYNAFQMKIFLFFCEIHFYEDNPISSRFLLSLFIFASLSRGLEGRKWRRVEVIIIVVRIYERRGRERARKEGFPSSYFALSS